jgi:hypothetical protein
VFQLWSQCPGNSRLWRQNPQVTALSANFGPSGPESTDSAKLGRHEALAGSDIVGTTTALFAITEGIGGLCHYHR